MLSEIDIFRDYLTTQKDAEIGQPATIQEIEQFEVQYDIKLPSDVKEYFLKINGVYVAGGFITLFPLNEWHRFVEQGHSPSYINNMTEMLEEAEQYFRFGCYDISVWDWSIKLTSICNSETPIVVTFKYVTKVAENLTDFLRLYRTSYPEDLLGE